LVDFTLSFYCPKRSVAVATMNEANIPELAHADEESYPKSDDDAGERKIRCMDAPGWLPGDEHPTLPKEEYIKRVVDILAEANIPSCVVGEHALNHYGAKMAPTVRKTLTAVHLLIC
jgi:hypothetical protein